MLEILGWVYLVMRMRVRIKGGGTHVDDPASVASSVHFAQGGAVRGQGEDL